MQAIQFLWDGGNTIRYHGIHTLVKDTVGHHSYNVTCIIMHLRPDASAKLLRAALKHDVAEHKVGDMPAPTKRALPDYPASWHGDYPPPHDQPSRSFREVFGDLETKVAKDHGVDLEQDLEPEEAWVLKLADAMDGMRFCIQESHMGNNTARLRGFFGTFRTYVTSLLLSESFSQPQDHTLFDYLDRQWRATYDSRK